MSLCLHLIVCDSLCMAEFSRGSNDEVRSIPKRCRVVQYTLGIQYVFFVSFHYEILFLNPSILYFCNESSHKQLHIIRKLHPLVAIQCHLLKLGSKVRKSKAIKCI